MNDSIQMARYANGSGDSFLSSSTTHCIMNTKYHIIIFLKVCKRRLYIIAKRSMLIEHESRDTKIVVVGGGVGGLATAAILAAEGFTVSIYEKTSNVGGRGLCKNIEGYLLDSGFHSIRGADKSAASTVLKKVGKEIRFATKYSDGVLPKQFYNGKAAYAPGNLIELLRYPLLPWPDKIHFMTLFQRIKKRPLDHLDEMTVSELLKELNVNSKGLIDHIKTLVGIAFYCDPDLEKVSAGELYRYLEHFPYDVGFPIGG
jgi:predicted NAD/FAD-binding protein